MTMLSLYTPESNAASHHLRLGLALKGGTLRGHRMADSTKARLISQFKSRGAMCLADNDVQIRDTFNALLYLDDVVPSPPFLSEIPANRAAVRIFSAWCVDEAAGAVESLMAGEGAEGEGRTLLKFWDRAGSALLCGNLSEGLTGERMHISLADVAAFPLMHRIAHLKRRGDIDLPLNRGTEACYRYLIDRYGMEAYQSSMTETERGYE